MRANPAVLLAFSLIVTNLFAVIWLFTVKFREKRAYRRSLAIVRVVFPALESGDFSVLESIAPEHVLEAMEKTSTRFAISREAGAAAAERVQPLLPRYLAMLRSPKRDNRMLAVYILRFFRPDIIVNSLRRGIAVERSMAVLLRAADTVVYLHAVELIPALLVMLGLVKGAAEKQPEPAREKSH